MENYVKAIETVFRMMDADFSEQAILEKAKIAGLNPSDIKLPTKVNKVFVREYVFSDVQRFYLPMIQTFGSRVEVFLEKKEYYNALIIRVGSNRPDGIVDEQKFDIANTNGLIRVLYAMENHNILPSIKDFERIYYVRSEIASIVGCD